MKGEENPCFTPENSPTGTFNATGTPINDVNKKTMISSSNSPYGSPKFKMRNLSEDPPPISKMSLHQSDPSKQVSESGPQERATWDNSMEFLMSCIATSVGLGNVWRFPFVAYQNGGGAFLVPYIIVLLLIGKPMYYLECIIGQFSSRNSVKVWSFSPAMRGTGYAQILGCGYILTYYVSIVGLCLYYLVMSFQAELPWTQCDPSWAEHCVPSKSNHNTIVTNKSFSSAELYFVKTVLQQKEGIEDGLGAPVWYLALCLFVSWAIIFVIVARGVKSSGKAAYFLALFPYVVMLILLITTLFLDGANKGIQYFFWPQWDKLLNLDVWYAAVTQVFYSISVCIGSIVMFSSYNGFKQNVYRDAMIVTTLDTFTSLLSGVTIFGILGNLAHELGTEVDAVVGSGGTGLAFISYPDAIAKTFMPQLFSVLFFLMMSVLGVGSGVALLSTINAVVMDALPRVRPVYASAACCMGGFLIGLVYVTPGGQFVLQLVDYYGGTFLTLFCAISEIIGVCWIYGLENICLDIEFMLGIQTSLYWRFMWGVVSPALMSIVFVYALASYEALVFGGYYIYPTAGYVSGYCMLIAGIIFVPIFMIFTLWKNRKNGIADVFKKSFHYGPSWGPRSPLLRQQWQQFRADAERKQLALRTTWPRHLWNVLTGGYRRRS